jgi:predicted glutamine amidotransferase
MCQHPFTHAKLADEDMAVNFAEWATPQDRVAVVVTQPLTTDEAWEKMPAGQLRVFSQGAIHA